MYNILQLIHFKMNTQITEEEYITDLLTNLPPKSWDLEEEEFIRICEEEEERERLEDLEEAEFLRIVEEEEEREREEEEEDQKELIRRHEDLERKRYEDLERKRYEDLERKREERELKELTVIRKALLADGKYVLEEGEILE